jgi:hypothetical protein
LHCKYLFLEALDKPPTHLKFEQPFTKQSIVFSSRTSTPRPPWSLGRHIIFYLVKRHFHLCPSLCQKNRNLRESRLFLTPLGISKNESINMGNVVSTEFIKINYLHWTTITQSDMPIFSQNGLQFPSIHYFQFSKVYWNSQVPQRKVPASYPNSYL